MGKINKYSNLYDKNGEFLHGPGSYTIQECEELTDKLAAEDSNSKAYANAMATLMHMYEVKGNPHKDEIIQKINDCAKSKTTKAEVINALNDLKDGNAHTTRDEEEVPGTPGGSPEEPRGEQGGDTNSESSIAA